MGPTRIGDYEIRYDDEETLQYEVVETISGNLLASFQTEPEAGTMRPSWTSPSRLPSP